MSDSVGPAPAPGPPVHVRRVDLVYSIGCPSSGEVHALLRSILLEQGAEALLALYEVRTQAQAEELRLLGSPTIRVDGRDVDPGGAASRPDLAARGFRRPDGTLGRLPSRAQLEQALSG